jgi:hypothetical protein
MITPENGVTNNLAPTEFHLSQNYPNPFKDRTSIKYCVPFTARVVITVYNTDGEMIEKLVNKEKSAGTYEIEFKTSAELPAGTYTCVLEAGKHRILKEMIYQK